MDTRLLLWARKRQNRDRIFEVWMNKATAKWLEKVEGVAIVKEGSVTNQYVVFIDPRYSEQQFLDLVDFCNVDPAGDIQ